MIADILLVDDNAVQAETRRKILEHTGRTVSVASSALEALDKTSKPELSTTLGLVITDHYMPGMNGPEFIQRLRQTMPSVPVLVISGEPGAEDEYRSLNVIFRPKPFAPEHLIALTRALLDEPLAGTAA